MMSLSKTVILILPIEPTQQQKKRDAQLGRRAFSLHLIKFSGEEALEDRVLSLFLGEAQRLEL